MYRACELKDQTYKKTRTLHLSEHFLCDTPSTAMSQARKKSTKINYLGSGDRPVGWGVFHAKECWPKSLCSPSKVCLPWVSKRNLGCPGNFAGMSRTLGPIYNVQMDAAVLGDRLPEGTQKPLIGPGSPSLQCRH